MHILTVSHIPSRAARRLAGAVALAVSTPIFALQAQVGSCAPARTALVLAGGGAKGLVHIGLLQTLDSLGIVPDLIVGTSMGAIVGALYASGDDGAAVHARMHRYPLHEIVRNYDPVVAASLEGLRPIVVWEREPARWVLQTGAVREADVSALVTRLALRANVLARGDFDSLPIPFRAVATALDDRSVVVLDSGDVALALRASMAVPLLLRPVVIHGQTLVDGGLASNVPVGVARRLGAERIIVSTIASPKPDPTAFDDPLTVTSALFEYLWVQDSLGLGVADVLVAQPTAAFNPLDLRPQMIDSLVRVGRRTADAALARAGCVHPLTTSHRARALPARVGHARIASPDVHDRDEILRRAALTANAPLDLDAVAAGVGRLATSERYRGLWLNPTGDSAQIDFDVTLDPAPLRSFGLGLAFDHAMSGRLWMGVVDRTLFRHDLEGTGLVTAGTYRSDLTLALRRRARIGPHYLPVGGSLELATEAVRRYQGAGELPAANTQELTLLVGLRPLFEPGWTYELGANYHVWREPGAPLRGSGGVRFAVRHRRGGVPVPAIALEGVALDAWQRIRLDVSHTDTVRHLEIRPRVRIGWGRDLPIQQTLALGGMDGFAGLRLLEQRGDHDFFGALLFRWPLWRRIHGRFEPMVGSTGVGNWKSGPGALDGVTLLGARIGAELDTPIGPIRVEQGFNNQNRRQALVRVGHWF